MKKIVAAVIALTPSLAFAHQGHTDNFIAAFVHPFTGVDHLLTMLCIGIFAGRIGGHARWQLPLLFLGAMTIGWMISTMGYTFAGVESGIAAGLIAFGMLFVIQRTPFVNGVPFAIQRSAIALFGVLHGMAHGGELSNATPWLTGIGMLAATSILHAAGVGIALRLSRTRFDIYRAMGAMLALVGGALLSLT